MGRFHMKSRRGQDSPPGLFGRHLHAAEAGGGSSSSSSPLTRVASRDPNGDYKDQEEKLDDKALAREFYRYITAATAAAQHASTATTSTNNRSSRPNTKTSMTPVQVSEREEVVIQPVTITMTPKRSTSQHWLQQQQQQQQQQQTSHHHHHPPTDPEGEKKETGSDEAAGGVTITMRPKNSLQKSIDLSRIRTPESHLSILSSDFLKNQTNKPEQPRHPSWVLESVTGSGSIGANQQQQQRQSFFFQPFQCGGTATPAANAAIHTVTSALSFVSEQVEGTATQERVNVVPSVVTAPAPARPISAGCNAFDGIQANAFAFFSGFSSNNKPQQEEEKKVVVPTEPPALNLSHSNSIGRVNNLKEIGKKHVQMLEQRLPYEERNGLESSAPTSAVNLNGNGPVNGDPDGKHGIDFEETASLLLGQRSPLFREPSEATTTNNDPNQLTRVEEAIAKPYQRMLKQMIPKGAKVTLRHKMRQEQVCERVIYSVLGSMDDESERTIRTRKEEAAAAAGAAAERYKKMLKLKIPKEAVRHKMMRDQVSKEIMRAVLGPGFVDLDEEAAKENEAAKLLRKDYPIPGKRRKSSTVTLHWTPLTQKELSNSLWVASKRRKVSSPTRGRPKVGDHTKLVELFEKKRNSAGTVKNLLEQSENRPDNTKARGGGLLDHHRSNNICITLSAFRDFTPEGLAETLNYLDPLHKLGGERIHFVPSLLPRPKEAEAFKSHAKNSDEEVLEQAEQWFQRVVDVKRLDAKAHTLVAMETFQREASDLQQMLQVRKRACDQILASDKLVEILETILQIGNVMNEGCHSGGALGFKFDSLLKLTQTKSNDGSMTVLDYLVGLFIARGKRNSLAMAKDAPDCHEASRLTFSELTASLSSLKKVITICRNEHRAMKAECSWYGRRLMKLNNSSTASHSKHNKEAWHGSSSGHGSRYPRMSKLFHGIANVAGFRKSDPKHNANTNNQEGIQQQQQQEEEGDGKKRNAVDPEEGYAISHKKKIAYQSEMKLLGFQRLDTFLKKAEHDYHLVKKEHNEALESCKEFSKYCGEGEDPAAADGLLGVLWEFMSNVDAAVKKHDEAKQTKATLNRRGSGSMSFGGGGGSLRKF